MDNDKFIVYDATDNICIGGFGNLQGNISLLKYTPEEITEKLKELNSNEDNIRLILSLLGSLSEMYDNWNKLKEWLLCMEEVSHLDIKCLQSVLTKIQEIESGKNE